MAGRDKAYRPVGAAEWHPGSNETVRSDRQPPARHLEAVPSEKPAEVTEARSDKYEALGNIFKGVLKEIPDLQISARCELTVSSNVSLTLEQRHRIANCQSSIIEFLQLNKMSFPAELANYTDYITFDDEADPGLEK
ncbi:MAG: hypothetical protein EXS55_01730 [Candidatus Magasanikbacteria bacterium]|nr:hypothetical protein [Candidatus Magasanikbacteria bacterium]